MDYTDNQVRVYQNSCLKLYEENDLQNLESTFGEIKELIELVKTPSSFDRYKSKDISFFREDQLEFVKEMGFSID